MLFYILNAPYLYLYIRKSVPVTPMSSFAARCRNVLLMLVLTSSRVNIQRKSCE
jgi:hypothetical protein